MTEITLGCEPTEQLRADAGVSRLTHEYCEGGGSRQDKKKSDQK